jgi:TIR domain
MKKTISKKKKISIWGDTFNEDYKLFISHLHNIDKKCANLKKILKEFNISCFVAHIDAEVSEPWQETIEYGLFSCDGLLALVTRKFHASDWTDQEVGVVYGRKKDMMYWDLGSKPKGFSSSIQAITVKGKNTIKNFDTGLKNILDADDTRDIKFKINDNFEYEIKSILKVVLKSEHGFKALINTLTTTMSQFDNANYLFEIIQSKDEFSNNEAKYLLDFYNINRNTLKHFHAVNGKSRGFHSGNYGLISLLNDKHKKKSKPYIQGNDYQIV